MGGMKRTVYFAIWSMFLGLIGYFLLWASMGWKEVLGITFLMWGNNIMLDNHFKG